MSTGAGISVLSSEFTDALTEVLAENAVGPARVPTRKGARGDQEAPRLQRFWISSGGRNRIKIGKPRKTPVG